MKLLSANIEIGTKPLVTLCFCQSTKWVYFSSSPPGAERWESLRQGKFSHTAVVDPSSFKRPCRSSAFTVISHIYTECPEQTDGLCCLHAAAWLLPLSWASRVPSSFVLLRPVSFHVQRLECWLDGISGLLRSLRVHPLSFFPPSARFCGSEFSRVRRLRKYNPQMSAGRLRYQKYPPGQLYSQGDPKNCCKAATVVWSSSRWRILQCKWSEKVKEGFFFSVGPHQYTADVRRSLF